MKHGLAMVLGILVLAPAADAQFEAAISKGRAYLRGVVHTEGDRGRRGLGTLALLKSGEKPDTPHMQMLIEKLRGEVADVIRDTGNEHTYTVGIYLMALVAAGESKYISEIEILANHLIESQNPNGSWDYVNQKTGDTSQSQYVLLGLWEAKNAGVDVPDQVWDNALLWHIKTQQKDGGFNYRPTDTNGTGTHTMTTAALGSLLICNLQLPHLAVLQKRKKGSGGYDLLIPVPKPGEKKVEFKVTSEMSQESLVRAQAWLTRNMTLTNPTTKFYYYYYALERYAALLSTVTKTKQNRIGNQDWHSAGGNILVREQKSNGAWSKDYTEIVDTAFALMFLGRTTEKRLETIKFKQLGAGQMVGGRGIPTSDAPSADTLGKQSSRYRDAYKTDFEDLLKAFDDPDKFQVDEGVVAKAETLPPDKLIKQFRGNLQKLRLMCRDERPEARRLALWALARSRDYRVIPVLVYGLADPDDDVYADARECLRYISRRMDAFGLPPERPDREALAEGMERAMDWFHEFHVDVEPDQEFDEKWLTTLPPPAK